MNKAMCVSINSFVVTVEDNGNNLTEKEGRRREIKDGKQLYAL